MRGVMLVRSLNSRSGMWRACFRSLIASLFQGHESGALKNLCIQFPCSASQNLPMLGIPSPPAHGGSWAVSKSTTVFFWYPFFQMKSFTAFCSVAIRFSSNCGMIWTTWVSFDSASVLTGSFLVAKEQHTFAFFVEISHNN